MRIMSSTTELLNWNINAVTPVTYQLVVLQLTYILIPTGYTVYDQEVCLKSRTTDKSLIPA